MFASYPASTSQLALNGKWKIYFIYGPACSCMLAGKQSSILVNIKADRHGCFQSAPSISPQYIANGWLIEGEIEFTAVLLVQRSPALFRGTWNVFTRQFAGEWWSDGPEDSIPASGSWIMESAGWWQ